MTRKDCGSQCTTTGRGRYLLLPGRMWHVLLIATTFAATPSTVRAGSIRLWPSAVVVNDKIHIGDLCELRGLESESGRALAGLVVTDAPAPGETLIIRIDAVRDALASGGANLAAVTLGGATRCSVSRPTVIGDPIAESRPRDRRPSSDRADGTVMRTATKHPQRDSEPGELTLRQAIVDHFNEQLARYGGRADVIFNRDAGKFLELSGPAYSFRIHARKSQPLGLIPLSIDVMSESGVLQTVSVVAQVSLTRPTVVARRAINQGATIQRQEVELTSLSLSRLDQPGLTATAGAIGQRAKRFIPAGAIIEPEALESVPLVTRGQLVTLTSVCGSVHVVTTAKAMQNGMLGDVIRVRALDQKHAELHARVLGPGKVEIGRGADHGQDSAVALGDQR